MAHCLTSHHSNHTPLRQRSADAKMIALVHRNSSQRKPWCYRTPTMLFDPLLNLVTFDIGMDLGTANTVVYVKGRGIVNNEPTVVAQHRKTKATIAVGSQAKKMIGRTPENIRTIQPVANGVIADFEATQSLISALLSQFHQQHGHWTKLPRPRIIIGVPSLVTEVERRAVVDAARKAGAREVYLVDESMASAIGSGLLTGEAQGRLLVDIGGGTTEMAVASLDGLVVNRSVPIAGWEMDRAIINFARDKHQILIGEQSAEAIKIEIGQAAKQKQTRSTMLRGRDLVSGLPRAVRITGEEIQEALQPILDQMAVILQELLEETPPELSADITESGLTLAGGGALTPGIDEYFGQKLQMKTQIADNPLHAVINGTAKLLDDPQMLKKLALPVRKKIT